MKLPGTNENSGNEQKEIEDSTFFQRGCAVFSCRFLSLIIFK